MPDGATTSPLPPAAVVRLATPADIEPLCALQPRMHAENAFASLSPAKMRDKVTAGCTPPLPGEYNPIIGIIEGPLGIEATVCLVLAQWWYSDEWQLQDLWLYVVPEFRQGSHFDRLKEFTHAVADRFGLPALIGLLTPHRAEAKARLYKQFGRFSGGLFIYEPS